MALWLLCLGQTSMASGKALFASLEDVAGGSKGGLNGSMVSLIESKVSLNGSKWASTALGWSFHCSWVNFRSFAARKKASMPQGQPSKALLLHHYKMILCGFMLSLFGSRMSLYSSEVNLRGYRWMFQSSRVSLRSSGVILSGSRAYHNGSLSFLLLMATLPP